MSLGVNVNPLNISPSSGVPIYKQVFSQIERMIINGHYASGKTLPSVRQLASTLQVNPMTISKAYGLLEERGFVTRLRGRGMVVAQQSQTLSAQGRMDMLNEMIDKLIDEAGLMGVPHDKLHQLLLQRLKNKSAQDQEV